MSFTVGQLLAALQGLPPDDIVVMAKDREGNGYSPLDEVDAACAYEALTTWSGEVHFPSELQEDDVPCVVLWPTN